MIKRITIKNFRSLKDVTVDLQDVNLFIGPNNSGKSNFFKALEFLSKVQMSDLRYEYDRELEVKNNYFGKEIIKNRPIHFTLHFESDGKFYVYKMELFNFSFNRYQFHEFFGVAKNQNTPDFITKNKPFIEENFSHSLINSNSSPFPLDKLYEIRQQSDLFSIIKDENNKYESNHLINWNEASLSRIGIYRLSPLLNDAIIYITSWLKTYRCYQIEPSLLKGFHPLSLDKTVDNSGANLVAFLDNLRDSNPEIIDDIVKDLKVCLKEFVNIRFEKGNVSGIGYDNYSIQKRIGLLDKQKVTYWSDELSDGVLYFLALLAIIHQPNPPKLIMLEEPEKGIHPRRIHEIIDYIFQLAESKGIQIILSSHSTYVVDEFKDIPEAVFVFDKEGAETKIKNLQRDVIEPSHEESEKAGLPKINYTNSLGDHWAVGFIGGVPK